MVYRCCRGGHVLIAILRPVQISPAGGRRSIRCCRSSRRTKKMRRCRGEQAGKGDAAQNGKRGEDGGQRAGLRQIQERLDGGGNGTGKPRRRWVGFGVILPRSADRNSSALSASPKFKDASRGRDEGTKGGSAYMGKALERSSGHSGGTGALLMSRSISKIHVIGQGGRGPAAAHSLTGAPRHPAERHVHLQQVHLPVFSLRGRLRIATLALVHSRSKCCCCRTSAAWA